MPTMPNEWKWLWVEKLEQTEANEKKWLQEGKNENTLKLHAQWTDICGHKSDRIKS